MTYVSPSLKLIVTILHIIFFDQFQRLEVTKMEPHGHARLRHEDGG